MPDGRKNFIGIFLEIVNMLLLLLLLLFSRSSSGGGNSILFSERTNYVMAFCVR
jgi:hypothetical protein